MIATRPNRALAWLLGLAFLWSAHLPAAVEVTAGPTEAQRNVVFSQRHDRETQSVAVVGSFNNWETPGIPMTCMGTSWTVTLTLAAPGEYEYKFYRNGTEWINDPDNPNRSPGAFGNNLLVLPAKLPPAEVTSPRALSGSTGPSHLLSVEYDPGVSGQAMLVFGLNGWNPPPEEFFPPGSTRVPGERGQLPRLDMAITCTGSQRVEFPLPAGSLVRFVLGVRTADGEFWDNNGGRDFSLRLDRDTQFLVNSGQVAQMVADRPLPRNALLAIGLLVLSFIVIGMGFWCRGSGYRTTLTRVAIAVIIALVAWQARGPRMHQTSDDMDEGAYVPVILSFTANLRQGNWQGIINESAVEEHPRGAFMAYALAQASTSGPDNYLESRRTSRLVAVLFAVATAFLLALRAPIAGALWALHGLAVHYTAVAYLDSPMAFFSVAAILAAERAFLAGPQSRRAILWFVVSAFSVGAAMSCKYLAAPIPLAIAVGFLVRLGMLPPSQRLRWAGLFAAYIGLALVAMIATDVRLWSSDFPVRILRRIQFHRTYSTTGLVHDLAIPWHRPLEYLWGNWFENRPPWMLAWWDRMLVILAVVGAPFAWRRAPLWLAAALLTLGFLLLWPTKWPQYIVSIIPALSMVAACGIDAVAEKLRGLLKPKVAGMESEALGQEGDNTTPHLSQSTE